MTIYAVTFEYDTSSWWVSSWIVWLYKHLWDAQEAMKEEREDSFLQYNKKEKFEEYNETDTMRYANDLREEAYRINIQEYDI